MVSLRRSLRLALACCAILAAPVGHVVAAEGHEAIAEAPAANAGLNFQAHHLNLGNISDGDVAEARFPFTNTTAQRINITRIQPSCGCTKSEENPTFVEPGQTAAIKVAFDSRGRLGRNVKSVAVFTDDPGQPEYRLSFEANVIAEVFLPRRVIDLGSVSIGDPITERFTLVAQMERPLKITSVSASDPALSVSQIGTRERTAAEGGGVEFQFELTASRGLPQGDFNGGITIETDNERSPFHYINLRANVAGDFVHAPLRLALVTEKGQETSRRITVTSRRGVAFDVASVVHDLPVPIEFSVDQNEANTEAIITAQISTASVDPRSYTGRATVNITTATGENNAVLVPIIMSVRPARASAPAPTRPLQGPALGPTQ